MKASDPLVMERLRQRLADVSAELEVVPRKKLDEWFQGWVAAKEIKSVALSDEMIVGELLGSNAGVEFLQMPDAFDDDWKNALADADLGVTACVGVAVETGSVLLEAGESDRRAVSLLPWRHLVLATPDQLLPTVSDLMKRWQEVSGEGNAVFVTGPSRTADIEKELVLGVHGPQEVIVAVLEG